MWHMREQMSGQGSAGHKDDSRWGDPIPEKSDFALGLHLLNMQGEIHPHPTLPLQKGEGWGGGFALGLTLKI